MSGKKFRWIRENVELGFDPPKTMRNEISEAEEYDLSGNYPAYCGVADGLDVLAKSYVASGRITEKQWTNVVNRYPGDWAL